METLHPLANVSATLNRFDLRSDCIPFSEREGGPKSFLEDVSLAGILRIGGSVEDVLVYFTLVSGEMVSIHRITRMFKVSTIPINDH